MSKNEFFRATENLRKTLPLMMKHKVAATPANYALWYTYIDKTDPALNQKLDNLLKEQEILLPTTNDYLYQHYIAEQTELGINQLRHSLESLMQEMGNSMSDTLVGTSSFSSLIDASIANLEKVSKDGLSIDNMMAVIHQLVIDSKEILNTTHSLSQQLTSASQEIEGLKRQLSELQKDALYDPLSNLYNRRAFDKDLAALCEAKQPLCLIMVDIDHFKQFNDEYGHLFGDMVIKAISRKLQQCCREGINVYRFGGEEFAILVPNQLLISAQRLAELNRVQLENIVIKNKKNDQEISHVTASFGVAQWKKGENATSLIERADKQLYEAKRAGRNTVRPL